MPRRSRLATRAARFLSAAAASRPDPHAANNTAAMVTMERCFIAFWLPWHFPSQGLTADRCSTGARTSCRSPVACPLPSHRHRTDVRGLAGVAVLRAVDAVVTKEELLRHQGLVGDVGMSCQRRHGTRAGIQSVPTPFGPTGGTYSSENSSPAGRWRMPAAQARMVRVASQLPAAHNRAESDQQVNHGSKDVRRIICTLVVFLACASATPYSDSVPISARGGLRGESLCV